MPLERNDPDHTGNHNGNHDSTNAIIRNSHRSVDLHRG
jgi:hypothetical protein